MINQQGDQKQQLPKSRRSLTLDTQKYQSMLDHPDMTQGQKEELIEALWTFVLSFMDLGYEVKSLENCGKQERIPDPHDCSSAPMLLSGHASNSALTAFAANAARKEAP